MDPRCRVEMFGPLRLVRGGQTLTRFGTQKAAALLAFLAARPGPQPREQVIDAFWPEMDLPAGRNNLNTALSALRHVLEPVGVRKGAVLVTSHAHIGLDPAAVSTDTADFERLLAQAERADGAQERAEMLSRALALYAGDFQPGNYQDWAVRESGRLSARRVGALDRQGDDLEALGRFAEAAQVARQRVEADPYEESAHVGLIRRLARAGQMGAAREAAAQFERFFGEEFGASPSADARKAVAEFLPQTGTPGGETGRRAAKRSPAPADKGTSETNTPMHAPIGPAAPTPAAPALPFWLSRFFGREDEMAQMVGLLLSRKDIPIGPDLAPRPCRLVTLLGPGGAGKTRLSAEFARMAAERHGLFCAFVPLADLSDPAQVPAQIAQALRLPPNPALTPLDQVTEFLCGRDRPGTAPALLVLDNLEHLLEAAQERAATEIVQTLLRDAPGLTLLTTSRRRLGLQGERLIPLGPLPVPETGEETVGGAEGLATLLQIPSVRLYVDRAQAVRPDFGLTAVNAPAVAALCRALEGSPLALELAASWVRGLPPRKMWERLSQGMEMPEGRHADLPDRHKSLAAALDWSWRLLTERQQRLLARVSVFRGGWTAEAAEAVCQEPDALPLLADLQEASLVTVTEGSDGEARYGLLETVRQDALRRLQAEGDEAELRGRHLAWCLTLAEATEPELLGSEQAIWLSRLAVEHDNMRAALDWSASDGDPVTGLRLAAALGRFWTVRGHMTEGRRRLEAALRGAVDAPPSLQAKASHALGALAHAQGDNAAAERHLGDCLTIRRKHGETAACADPLRLLAMVARQRGDYDTARTLLTESLTLARAAGSETDAVGATVGLGHVAMLTGDLDRAKDLYGQSLSYYQSLGDRRGWAGALGNLGNVASMQGNHSGAQSLLAECLNLYREIGDRRGCAITRHSQSTNALKSGDLDTALLRICECIALYRDLGDRWNTIDPLTSLSLFMAQKGRWERAARLRGAAEAMREERGIRLSPSMQEERAKEVCALSKALGETAFTAAWGFGQALSWEQAVEYALQDHDPEKD